MSVERFDGGTVLNDVQGRPVVKLCDDGQIVVNSTEHVLDARALGSLDYEALTVLRAWCDRQLGSLEGQVEDRG